jgi:hypothetical protein
MPVGIIAALLVLGGLVLAANAASAAPRVTAYTRERFARTLAGMGANPRLLGEVDWQIIDRMIVDAERIGRLPPEQHFEALRASAPFRAYIEMMMTRFPDIARGLVQSPMAPIGPQL